MNESTLSSTLKDCAVELEPCVCDPVRSRNHAVRCFEIDAISASHLLVHANVILLQPDSRKCTAKVVLKGGQK